MTKEKATSFFAILFGGYHHIGAEIKQCGYGWQINTGKSFATYDGDLLTRLVLMCHQYAVRAEVENGGPGRIKIKIWQRQREGKLYERHPDIHTAIENNQLPDEL